MICAGGLYFESPDCHGEGMLVGVRCLERWCCVQVYDMSAMRARRPGNLERSEDRLRDDLENMAGTPRCVKRYSSSV